MDAKKYLLRYSRNMQVLMTISAVCTVVSQSEKADAMLRTALSRAASVVSSTSSNSTRVAASGARTVFGTPSTPNSTNTAPGSVVYDKTAGGSPVFVANPWSTRMHYGETDASVIVKEIGPNIYPGTKYNVYYDGNGNAVVRSTNLGRTLREIFYGEIRTGMYVDPETGDKSRRIVIASPWWVSGSDLAKRVAASKSTDDEPTVKIPVTVTPSGGFTSTDTSLDSKSGTEDDTISLSSLPTLSSTSALYGSSGNDSGSVVSFRSSMLSFTDSETGGASETQGNGKGDTTSTGGSTVYHSTVKFDVVNGKIQGIGTGGQNEVETGVMYRNGIEIKLAKRIPGGGALGRGRPVDGSGRGKEVDLDDASKSVTIDSQVVDLADINNEERQ